MPAGRVSVALRTWDRDRGSEAVMDIAEKASLVEAHRARWKTFWVWLGFVSSLIAVEGLLAWAVVRGSVLLAIPATLLVAHLMHSQLLAFHEAAHGVLCPSRTVNELI